MERINYNYSLKNIPIQSKNSYTKSMINKTESLVKRMRWKAFFHDNPTPDTNQQRNNFGFPSEKSPPQNKDLIPFENDMYNLIKYTQFKRPQTNQFQQTLKRDIRELSCSEKIFVPADKTTNIYKLSSVQYQKLLTDNITATYKKSSDSTKNSIDLEAKNIAGKLKIADRVESFARREAFITLKDHKDNFANNPKCRLINPAKSEIGLISKQHLEKIVASVQQ